MTIESHHLTMHTLMHASLFLEWDLYSSSFAYTCENIFENIFAPAPCLGYKATCSSDINAQPLNKIAFLISEGLRWRSYRRSVDGQSNLYQAWEWQSIIKKKKKTTSKFKKCSKGWPRPKNIGTLKTDRLLKGDRFTGCHLIQVQS